MSETIKGLVSIIFPTYNEREDLLRNAVECALGQTYPNVELIVVDDGSTDGTPDVLRSYGKDLVYVRRERTSEWRSVSEAINAGAEHIRGQWVHNDAADCYLEKTWAEEAVEFVAGREDEVAGVHTDFVTHYLLEDREEHFDLHKIYDFKLSTFENYKSRESLGGWLWKRENWERTMPWDVRFPRKQTREFFLRILRLGSLVYLPRELWHFVFHEPDQMKTKASIKYRILGDLKNGWDVVGNVRWGLSREDTKDAVVAAFKAFYEDPEWESERKSGPWAKRADKINREIRGEAVEPWEESDVMGRTEHD